MMREKYMVRVLNPSGRVRNMVRVNAADAFAPLSGSPHEVFQGFRGRKAKSAAQLLEARPGTPATVAELGGLVELVLDVESHKKKGFALAQSQTLR